MARRIIIGARPPGLGFIDPAGFVLALTRGTYSALVQETLGTAMTEADGVDLKIGETALLQAALEADLPNLDTDIAELVKLGPILDTLDASVLLGKLGPMHAAFSYFESVFDVLFNSPVLWG